MPDTQCAFCGKAHYPQGPAVGNGPKYKVQLSFDSGRVYIIPDNLDHMVLAHEFQPSHAFVGDVMNARLVPEGLAQAHGKPVVIEADENYPIGTVPPAFPYRLQDIIQKALNKKTLNS
jgi:hypothetical protein